MIERQCPCGARIPLWASLCAKCREQYGDDRSKWPQWLRWYVSDIQREINYLRRHKIHEVHYD